MELFRKYLAAVLGAVVMLAALALLYAGVVWVWDL